MSNTPAPGGRSAYGHADTPPEILSNEDFHAICRTLHGPTTAWGIRNLAMLEAIYYNGLRKGEARYLKTERIAIGDRPYVFVRKSKNDKGRNVPLDPRCLRSLAAWAGIRPQSEWFFCTVLQRAPNGISKGNPPGSVLSHGVLNRLLTETARRAGVQGRVWPHMLRHSRATEWLNTGFNLEEVRILLGHENVATTQRYLHVALRDLENKIYGTTHTLDAPVASKDCPQCAEPIKLAATRCRWCHTAVAA